MTAPVEEVLDSIEDLLDPDEGHIVCCEDVTKTLCSDTIPEREYTGDEPITCAPCLEEEHKRGVAACPKFAICAHTYCTPWSCNVRG